MSLIMNLREELSTCIPIINMQIKQCIVGGEILNLKNYLWFIGLWNILFKQPMEVYTHVHIIAYIELSVNTEANVV